MIRYGSISPAYTDMTTAGSAKRLRNCYKIITEFTCPALKDGYEALTVEIPINIRPLDDVWHYLGIVVTEVEGDGTKQDRAVR